ncbi:hypothetical protein [Streptomyces sp. NPDC046832]|uniref:hypothetical protein n=1 Tax=Streptomyces sp. NPDC046832 TaxID=3155020 RepID=UPI0033F47678
MTKGQKNAACTLALYALVVVMLRSSSVEESDTALLIALVITPLALWMGWLRRRMNEQAAEWGRRRFRPWPEERRR